MTATTTTESQALSAAIAAQKILSDVFGEKFARGYQGTFVPMRGQVLQSPTAQRFFDKDFAFLSRQMHYEYQYRTWFGFNSDILDRYAEIIGAKLAKINEAQQNWINRLTKLLEQNDKASAEVEAMFPNRMVVDVPIIAPQARMYLEVLKQLDKVYVLAGSAWAWGIIDSKQNADQQWFCKKMVRAFRAIMQQEVIKLHREAKRLQEHHRDAGTVDELRSALVDEQGEDIKTFQQHSDSEDRTGGDVAPSNPGAAIDEAARIAQAGAATAKTVRRRAASASAPSDTAAPASAPEGAAT